MPVLKYHNGTAWTEVSAVGVQGAPGPPGDTGPAGPTAINAISDLGDVDTTGAANGNALAFAAGMWMPRAKTVITDHAAYADVATGDGHPQYFNQTRGDARYLQTMKGTWTPGPNWQAYASFGELIVTRVGDFTTVEGVLQTKSAITIAVNGSEVLGTIPVGFRPPTIHLGIMTTNSWAGNEYGRLDIGATGILTWVNNTGVALSLPNAFWCAPLASYRSTP